jgi:hypothetical protein
VAIKGGPNQGAQPAILSSGRNAGIQDAIETQSHDFTIDLVELSNAAMQLRAIDSE